jgi:dihydroorotate dehydrogenase (NAD+) catalytic subunit
MACSFVAGIAFVSDYLATNVGEVSLRSPILTAAGTSGYGSELAGYGDLSELGGVVTKSLSAFEWSGNDVPRLTSSHGHMVNAVGLAGPGVVEWRRTSLRQLEKTGATIVASIWGRNVGEFADAALAMKGANISALEVNASCPNLENRSAIFAHSASATSDIVHASMAAQLPLWVKLSPNTPDLVAIAGAALDAGASALVLINTVLGLVIDIEQRRPALANGGGGVSGHGILPVALRAVWECREAFPDTPIVGVGGITTGDDAVAMLMAGANAVEVGTAIFADPRAPWKIQRSLTRWMKRQGVGHVRELIGAAHG